MEPIEHDVYVSYRRESGEDLARLVADGLKRRGFRVLLAGREAATDAAKNLRSIEVAPDFVVILSPGSLDPAAADDETREEIAHALKHERNIVPVFVPGFVRPPPADAAADLGGFPWRDAVPYKPLARNESIARIAHMLASDTSVGERRLDRQAKRLFVTLGVALLAVAAIEVVRALPKLLARPFEPPPLPPLSLAWSGFGQRFENGRWVEFAVENGGRVLAGDQIKLVFSVTADAYAYVVTTDRRGEISVLFPARSLKANTQVKGAELYEAPFDGSWAIVSEPDGLQGIYVLASYDPIENLESMVEERDEESSIQGRQSVLTSTIEGLLDGRHTQARSTIRTRRGRAIVQNLKVAPPAQTASTALAGGQSVTHTLVQQPGLMSAVAEVQLRYDR